MQQDPGNRNAAEEVKLLSRCASSGNRLWVVNFCFCLKNWGKGTCTRSRLYRCWLRQRCCSRLFLTQNYRRSRGLFQKVGNGRLHHHQPSPRSAVGSTSGAWWESGGIPLLSWGSTDHLVGLLNQNGRKDSGSTTLVRPPWTLGSLTLLRASCPITLGTQKWDQLHPTYFCKRTEIWSLIWSTHPPIFLDSGMHQGTGAPHPHGQCEVPKCQREKLVWCTYICKTGTLM